MTYDSLGMLLMKGLADKEILYNSQASYGAVYTWNKYKDILLENRRLYSGNDAWIGFEYLADELYEMKLQKDPNWNMDMASPKYEDTWRTESTPNR